MKRHLYRTYIRTIRLTDRIRRAVTPLGFLMITVAFFAFVFGSNPEKSYLYQLLSFALSFLIVALLFSLRFRTNIHITPRFPDRCSVGETVKYSVIVTNTGRTKEDGLLFKEEYHHAVPSLEEFLTQQEEGEEKRNKFDRLLGYYRWMYLVRLKRGFTADFVSIPALFPSETQKIVSSFTPLRRGYIRINGLRLFRTDPFGLFRRSIMVTHPANMLVYPPLYPVHPLLLTQEGAYSASGHSSSSRKGYSGDFVSLRSYIPGDPLKYVDWKSTAKQDDMMVREFTGDTQGTISIFVDTHSSLAVDPAVEEAISFAASLITSLRAEHPIETLMTSETVFSEEDLPTEAKNTAFLDILATLTTTAQPHTQPAISHIERHRSSIGRLIIMLASVSEQTIEVVKTAHTMRIPATAFFMSKTPPDSSVEHLCSQHDIRIMNFGEWRASS